MKMKRQLYFPLLIMVLASLIFGVLPLGQPSIVYAAPDTLTLLPDGSGNYTNIEDVEPAGTPHWDAVNDLVGSPDDITTYISTPSATQQKDAYTLQDTTQTGIIDSVTVYFRGRSSKVKIHYFQPFLRLSDNETIGTEIDVSINTWATYSENLTRPGGGSWTWTDINDLQVAIGLRSLEAGEPQLTQIYVEVNYTLPDISNTPSSYGFGVLAQGATNETGLTHFTVTNNGSSNVTITIGGTDMTGDFPWTLDNDGNPGPNTYGLWAGRPDLTDYTIIVNKAGGNTLVSNLLGEGGTQDWGLKIWAPTSFTGGGVVSGNVTLTIAQS